MKDRRKFLKAAAIGAGSISASKLAVAQAVGALPAVNSLLLDDDSEVLACESVPLSDFSVELNRGSDDDLILVLGTPGGTQLVHTNGIASGRCNAWDQFATQGVLEFRLQGGTI